MFYVAHRLFAAHDRQLGALIAGGLAARVGAENVFLPFCDTDEETLTAEVKGRRLFELDRHRLRCLDGMLAVLHGPCLDDGVCMEIGYAASLGVPVVVLTTDFQTYGLTEQGPELEFLDPLVEAVVTEIVRVDRLGQSSAESANRFHDFAQRNQMQIQEAIDRAVRCLLTHVRMRTGSRPIVHPSHAAFCEVPSCHPKGLPALIAYLGKNGVQVRRCTRFEPGSDPVRFARADWIALMQCDLLVVDVSGPETPPGAALMIGASVATGRRIVALDPQPSWTFAQGREPNWRNLMIQYSIDERLVGDDVPKDLLRR